ncbi:MFS transporter [Cellvibrio sp. ARAG 10.3]|uniref:MFS transporter n=1 Tax=Cellvibrio sp. ARAG 10.3 TaxID=3451358 RepID=UPI003F4851F1
MNAEAGRSTAAGRPKKSRAGIFSWMLFDWAAQPFFTVIITFIFGPYFVSRLAQDAATGQAAWGYTITVSGIIVAVLAPMLGSVADATGTRKPWIAVFALIKIITLMLLWFASPGSDLWLPAMCIVLATVAAEFSIVFNDSMMPRLVPEAEIGRISNLGWGLGYLGGLVVLFTVLLFLSGSPTDGKTLLGLEPWFGLDASQGEDARITGPFSALWYLIFILPMFLFTPDGGKGLPLKKAVKSGLVELKNTLVELKQRAGVLRFFIARMIYQDGVNGLLALGGTFAAGMFGWQTMEMGIYGILLLIVAIGGCLVASWLDAHLGSKRLVLLSLICLVTACVGIISTGPGYTLFGWVQLAPQDSGTLFGTAAEKAYILFGLLIGIAFGPVQASSRSYLARSVSPEEAGRYFGIYALSGRVTSFLAPMSVATLTLYTDSARIGMSALIVFLLVGLLMLWVTPYPATRR